MDGLTAYALVKKYINNAIGEISLDGFDIQIEQDRSILNSEGQEKIIYFVPKTTATTQDGYDEYAYINNSWEKVGSTDIDMSVYALKTEIPDVSGKENTSNKVTSVSASSTDDQYPSAKCVYDIMLAVSKTDISSATVTLSADSFVYDGTSKVPSVTVVTLDGATLTAGVDYAVVSVPATNAGSYSLSVNGIGDYTGVVTASWVITKATPTISGDDSISITGTSELVSKTYTTNSDGAFSFALSDNIAALSNVGGTVTIESTATGSATLTVSVAATSNYNAVTKTVSLQVTEAQTATVFGVMWDYSLSSPQLARLTPQTDPLSVVTTVPSQEPTACVGNDGNGQSDFDNYMPWAGMQRYNYVNGQVVDFVDYSNGETFVYIPEFWSKIVDDSVNSKMYFYISSAELEGFSKHPGGRRYIGRYSCDNNFMSTTGAMPKVNTTIEEFRTGITAIANHFQFDFNSYSALSLLYIVEYADFNSQAKIGEGITEDSNYHVVGETDILNYHTGRIGGVNNQSAIQYRWIENLWGNFWNFVDGILINDHLIYICNNINDYTSINNYINTQLITPTATNQYVKKLTNYDNYYLMPKECGGSSSTYICDDFISNTGIRYLATGGRKDSALSAGMFCWSHYFFSNESSAATSSRSILILGGDS